MVYYIMLLMLLDLFKFIGRNIELHSNLTLFLVACLLN